jgi:hypothetical protein
MDVSEWYRSELARLRQRLVAEVVQAAGRPLAPLVLLHGCGGELMLRAGFICPCVREEWGKQQ